MPLPVRCSAADRLIPLGWSLSQEHHGRGRQPGPHVRASRRRHQRHLVRELELDMPRLGELTIVGLPSRPCRPPPPVEVTQGDIVKIHAYNGLNVPSSLHAHGMFFNGSNYMDGTSSPSLARPARLRPSTMLTFPPSRPPASGPVGVTQCGIPPGGTFDYEIDTSLQYGTYWIHAHNLGALPACLALFSKPRPPRRRERVGKGSTADPPPVFFFPHQASTPTASACPSSSTPTPRTTAPTSRGTTTTLSWCPSGTTTSTTS